MRLCIAGAGAVGLSYAARLAGAAVLSGDRRLTVATRRPEACIALDAGLAVISADGSERTVKLRVSLTEQLEPASQDLVLLAVKTMDNIEVLPLVARALAPGGVCLSVQNGVANLSLMRQVLGSERAFQGATGVGGTALAPSRVRATMVGKTWIPATMPHAAALAAWLQDAGMEPVVLDDLGEVQWRKAALAVAGPVAVILDRPFGEIVRNRDLRALMRAATLEAVSVAAALQVELDRDSVIGEQEAIWDAAVPEALSSMLADYRSGRPSEVEDRFGAIVRLARENGVAVPVLETLYVLVRERLVSSLES